MADKEIHHYSGGDGGSGMGAFLGIIVGAVLVVGLLFVFANNWQGGGSGTSTSSAPSAPSSSAPSTTGSGSSGGGASR